MSHYSFISIKIVNPDVELLKKAFLEIFKDNKVVVDQIEDYYKNKLNVVIGVKNDVFKRGIGVVINNNNVEIVGDFYNVRPDEIERVKNELVQNYLSLAVEESLKNMGYDVVKEKLNDRVIIIGEVW